MTIWSELPLTEQHAAYLRDQAAITAEVAADAGIRSATTVNQLPEWAKSWGEQAIPAIVFPWRSPAGEIVEQVRPDAPVVYDGEPHKYLWPRGAGAVLNAIRVDAQADAVLIVEGTKQAYAAASWTPDGVAIYGVGGCRNWSADGIPLADLGVCHGRKVVVALDADAATNPEVYAAGLRIGSAVRAEGAASVAYIQLPASGSAGLDDVLARRPADDRTAYVERLIGLAKAKPADTKPRTRDREKVGSGLFFDDSGALLVDRLARVIQDRMPAALTEEQRIALYRDGVFNIEKSAIIGAVSEMLGDRFRPGHRSTVEEYLVGLLFNANLLLPIYTSDALLNVKNGMLDLATGTLKPHDPAYLSSQQVPIDWDPDATCPTYEAWVDSCGVAGQVEDLEETTSTMLDPSRTPPKAVFLFGPSRSGKSTYLRLMQNMIGPRNLAAVTLHQLSQNRFAAANVFGKMLNCAADLSSAHVDDISIFKMMTGEDPIQADRKYGGQFAFTNRALFAFSANELPTVGESSRAYTERIKPFEFAITFAGRENPELEARMIADELPGILVRWVRAWQRRHQRGTYLPTDPQVMHEFEVRSDRVRQWLDDRCTVWRQTADGQPVGYGTTVDTQRASTKAELAKAFNVWADDNNGSRMGQRKIIDRLMTIPGVTEVRRLPGKVRALNVTVRKDTSGAWEEIAEPTPSGGSFDGPVAGYSPVVAVSGPETATASGQVEGSRTTSVAEVAISSPPYSPSLPQLCQTATEGELGGVSSGVGQGGSETATSATSATRTISRPDVDRAERDLAEQGVEQIDLFISSPAVAATEVDPELTYERLAPAAYVGEATELVGDGVLVFDIEGDEAQKVFTAGPEFMKIFGYQVGGDLRVTEDVAEAVELLRTAKKIVGHNILGFDLMYFAIHHGMDLHQLAADGRLYDTQLAEVLLNPPPFWMKAGQVPAKYKLDVLGDQKFGVGKSADLKDLVKKHGGTVMAKGNPGTEFARIPNDDAEYVRYCAQDVDLTTRIGKSHRPTKTQADYIRREMRIAAIAAQVQMNGVRVDIDLLQERYRHGQERKAAMRAKMIDLYGFPATTKTGKASKGMSPAGRIAVERAFGDLGIDLPRSASGDGPATGKEVMDELIERYTLRPEVVELAQTVKTFNGERTVYGTALAHLHPNGRVHPSISMYQASGRWSVQNPGMTVFGKRGGRHVEREIFVADEGEVIIAADLSQVDARAVAAWCQDENYLAMFQGDMDLHAEVAFQMFGDRGRRDDAKAISHGSNYGLGFNRLAEKHGEELARKYLDTMRDQFPRLGEWKLKIKQEAIDNSFILDNGWGRTLVIDPSRVHTQSAAYVGQSAARDIMMEGLLRLPRWVLPMLRVQVHDEIVLSVPEDRVDEIKAVVKGALSFPWRPFNGARGHAVSVDIEADASKAAKCWGAVYASK